MSNELTPLSSCLAITNQRSTPVAYHAGQYYDAGQFRAAAGYWINRLRAQPFKSYALYSADAYPFAVMLLALFHAGKDVWIPGNNCPGTATQLRQLDCQLLGDWQPTEPFVYHLDCAGCLDGPLTPLSAEDIRLVMFTSGSTGEAKAVEKRLKQLEIEIAALEKQWGHLLQGATALATVSHQHIYGLLFRVLWPLSAGRCFHSQLYINPETLVRDARRSAAYWVASPAQLKRLDLDSPWGEIAELKALFSSGSPLQQDAAKQILTRSGQSVIEIYGSTESGGIAWRQQDSDVDTAWRLFQGLTLTAKDDGFLLHSPYLSGNAGLALDDRICLQDDGCFLLLGRRDRIVKIEEKRLSLTELEMHLLDTPWISEVHAVKLSRHRDVVGIAAVLSEQGATLLTEEGRSRLIKRLRRMLSNWFDAVVLPRKWLFLNRMPLSAQGKIEQSLLMDVLGADTGKLPQLLELDWRDDKARLQIKVPEDLIYFPDHFKGFPILPGVVQIAWADHFGKLFFSIEQPFMQMEVLKFAKMIVPGIELKLTLEWKVSAGKLYFNYSSEQGIHGSGRLAYGAES